MAGERVLPGVGLKGFATPGSDAWNTFADENWRIISALMQGVANSYTVNLPASPADGEIHIIHSSGPSNPNKIAVRDNGAWVYITPKAGWRMSVPTLGLTYVFNGSAWSEYVIGRFTTVNLFPAVSAATAINGEMTFQKTSDTVLTIKVQGADGIVRKVDLALAP